MKNKHEGLITKGVFSTKVFTIRVDFLGRESQKYMNDIKVDAKMKSDVESLKWGRKLKKLAKLLQTFRIHFRQTHQVSR